MNLSEFTKICNQALELHGDIPVLLCYEQSAMEEGYKETETEGVSDVRLVEDWPLPGSSLVVDEVEKPKRFIVFYDNHYNLDSAHLSSL
jgi:hypothetical protein